MMEAASMPTAAKMALVGVRPCGCITAVQIEGFADEREMAQFYTEMADTNRKVERVVFDEVKGKPNFLNCVHDGQQ